MQVITQSAQVSLCAMRERSEFSDAFLSELAEERGALENWYMKQIALLKKLSTLSPCQRYRCQLRYDTRFFFKLLLATFLPRVRLSGLPKRNLLYRVEIVVNFRPE
jgi:hypothetical protein